MFLRARRFLTMVMGMNAPQTKDLGLNPVEIADLRAQINAIDYEIASLIAQRSSYAKLIAAAKIAEGDLGFGWRPAREVEILRGLLAREPDLDPGVAASVWRVLIATNLAAQGGLEVFATLETAPAARSAFGAAVQTSILPDARSVLQATQVGSRAIGVLPWIDTSLKGPRERWWTLFLEPQFDGLHVCAASPQVRAGKAPEAVLIANRTPEAAGQDKTLIIAPSGSLAGAVLDQHQGLDVVLVEGFVSDPSAGEVSAQRLLGCFALA
jgi:chorismate mutase